MQCCDFGTVPDRLSGIVKYPRNSVSQISSGKLFRAQGIHYEPLAYGSVSCSSWRSRHVHLVRGFELQTLEENAVDVAIRVIAHLTLLQVLPELRLPATCTVFQRRQTEQTSCAPLHALMQEVQANSMGYQPTCANHIIW